MVTRASDAYPPRVVTHGTDSKSSAGKRSYKVSVV